MFKVALSAFLKVIVPCCCLLLLSNLILTANGQFGNQFILYTYNIEISKNKMSYLTNLPYKNVLQYLKTLVEIIGILVLVIATF